MNLSLRSPGRSRSQRSSDGECSTTPAIRLATLVPLHQNDRRTNHDRRAYKTEWIQGKTAPVE